MLLSLDVCCWSTSTSIAIIVMGFKKVPCPNATRGGKRQINHSWADPRCTVLRWKFISSEELAERLLLRVDTSTQRKCFKGLAGRARSADGCHLCTGVN